MHLIFHGGHLILRKDFSSWELGTTLDLPYINKPPGYGVEIAGGRPFGTCTWRVTA